MRDAPQVARPLGPSRRIVLAAVSAGAISSTPPTVMRAGRCDDPIFLRLEAEQGIWRDLLGALAAASRAEDALHAEEDGERAVALEAQALDARSRADAAQNLHDRARATLYDTAPSTAAGAVALLERIVEREHDMQGATPEVLAALAHASALLGRLDIVAAASGLRAPSDRDPRRG